MPTISAKCTKNTKVLINTILEKYPFFMNLEKEGVYANPSWLCKFSIGLLLQNIKMIEKNSNIIGFAYQSHYVDDFDEKLEQFIIDECN